MKHLYTQSLHTQHAPFLQERAGCWRNWIATVLQVLSETAPALKALGACNSDCWLWPSITQVQPLEWYKCCRATLTGLIVMR